MIAQNKQLSRNLDDLAREIDLLLASRRVSEKTNKTRAILSGFMESREGRAPEYSAHINLDLRLPNLEEEWKLKFSSYDEEDEFEGLDRNRYGAQPQEQKYGASIAYVREIKSVKTTLRPRIELKDPLVSGFLLKLENVVRLTFMDVKSQLKLFAHSEDGTGQAFTIDFERKLTSSTVLRLFNEQQYLEKDNLFIVAQGPSILYKINDRMALSPTFSFQSTNRHTPEDRAVTPQTRHPGYHLEGYSFYVSFRHQLYKNILHYQVTPNWAFTKEYQFKGRAGVNLNIEVIF